MQHDQKCNTKRNTKKKKARKIRAFSDGVEGSRTPVQKPIHRPSTIIVRRLEFPPPYGGARPYGFGSFI